MKLSKLLYFFRVVSCISWAISLCRDHSQKATPNAFASKQDDGLRTTRIEQALGIALNYLGRALRQRTRSDSIRFNQPTRESFRSFRIVRTVNMARRLQHFRIIGPLRWGSPCVLADRPDLYSPAAGLTSRAPLPDP